MKTNLSNKIPFVSVKDYKSETKPSYYAYVKKNNIHTHTHTHKTDNSEEMEKDRTLITIPNVFIHKIALTNKM